MGNPPTKLGASMGCAWMIIVLLACFFGLLPSSVQGLKCYECGKSNEQDCKSNNIKYLSQFEKECAPGAIACLQYRIQRDFVFNSKDWDMSRTCVYPGDMKCLIGRDNVSTADNKRAHHPFYYKTAMDCLRESRSKLGLTPPESTESLVADHQHTHFWYRLTDGDLSNSKSNKHLVQVDSKNIWDGPGESDRFCYYCDVTEVSTKFNYKEEDHEDKGLTLIPSCNGKETQIYCWGSIGCAASWETRKSAEGKLITRIWRGCWNSGDQQCVRRPTILEDKDVDIKDDKDDKDYDEDEKKTGDNSEECDKLMRDEKARTVSSNDKATQSYEVYGVAWSGLNTIPNFESYNKYLECKDFNERVNGGSRLANYKIMNKKLKQLTKEERPPSGDKQNFARIRYYFCKGYYETRCNIWEGMTEADVPELPPTPPLPTTTTTPTPSATESPEILKRGEKLDGCYPTGKNAGSSLLNHGISITTLSLASLVLPLWLSFM